ncbi:hypothetical protein H0H92_015180 [Tricholoma furcatifolium]|nr:hypothetical protein H0H92_015180 [Tricholoma furcatifolium]
MTDKRRSWAQKWSGNGARSSSTTPSSTPQGTPAPSIDLPRSDSWSSLRKAQEESSTGNNAGSNTRKSFSSMMMGALSRTSTRDNEDKDKEARGRQMSQISRVKSASDAESDRSRSRGARSLSPFTFRRRRTDPSPPPSALHLSQSDVESDVDSNIRPRSTAFSYDSDTDYTEDDADWSNDEDVFDDLTERNTEQNAHLEPPIPLVSAQAAADEADPDPLGEGVNVVVPPEPFFPSTLNSFARSASTKRNPRRRKSTKHHHEPLLYETSRPVFQRDRCTITITQGDPVATLGTRKKRSYIVASDLSEESRYAVEWAIGTVLRDGDELLIVTVTENDSKVDPPMPNPSDRATKLRSQQERQGLAYILVRQATSLLQRTKLNVKVVCQAWHAKNARHMLLDIVDYHDPQLVIVGSRGLGQLKGILLGSTSHYLIQKCSVPVMVARRRLKRPPRRSAHLSTHRTHVSLADAGIDRVVHKVDEDVQVMREEIQRDDDRRDRDVEAGRAYAAVEEEEGEEEEEEADDAATTESHTSTGSAVKVAGH